MTRYMIRTPTIQHVIQSYKYMKRRGIKISEDSLLKFWIKHNCVSELVKIKAVYIDDDVYDGYSTTFDTMVGYDEIIHLEETVTL